MRTAGYLKNGVTTIPLRGTESGCRRRAARSCRAERNTRAPDLFVRPMLDRTPPAYPKWTSPVDTPVEAASTARRLLTEEGVEALLVTQQITLT